MPIPAHRLSDTVPRLKSPLRGLDAFESPAIINAHVADFAYDDPTLCKGHGVDPGTSPIRQYTMGWGHVDSFLGGSYRLCMNPPPFMGMAGA